MYAFSPPLRPFQRKMASDSCRKSGEQSPRKESSRRCRTLAWIYGVRQWRASRLVPIRPQRGTSSHRQQAQLSRECARPCRKEALANHVFCGSREPPKKRRGRGRVESRSSIHQEKRRRPRRGLPHCSLAVPRFRQRIHARDRFHVQEIRLQGCRPF